MQLTIHRGTHEIGGNCVEVRTNSTRIILDVGRPLFNADREQFDDNVLRDKSVDELLEAKILPACRACSLKSLLLMQSSFPTPTWITLACFLTPGRRFPSMPPRAPAR